MTAVLTSNHSWRLGYGMVAAGQLLLALAFVATRRSWPDPPAVPARRAESPAASLLRTLRLRPVALGSAAFFVYTGLEAVAGVWAYSFLTSVRGFGMAAAGLGVSLYWADLTVGRILFGVLVRRTSLTPMLRASLVLLLFAAGGVWLAASPVFSMLALGLLGLAAGPVFPSLMSGTPQRVPDGHAANAIGLQVAAAALGQSLLPASVGVLATSFGLVVVGPALMTAALLLLIAHEAMAAIQTATRNPVSLSAAARSTAT
jgi:fucose permease